MVLTALYPLGLSAQGIADIVSRLESVGCYEAEARFSVTLPQCESNVIYTVNLSSAPAPTDPLAPCSYLTDWSLETPTGTVKGFSAYFDGHHYRYRNERLQEYHMEWDSVPFRPTGRSAGVQGSAQFADLYPAFIARELKAMTADPRYTVTVSATTAFNGRKAVKVSTTFTVSEVVATEKDFFFDAETMLPLRIDTESNPGQITEQTIFVSYTYPPKMNCPELSDAALTARYPEIFEKYRENNFHIENLAGSPMPTFTLPTTTGERYTHHRGEKFVAPTVIALLDPDSGFNTEIVKAIRGAADSLPKAVDVIWVFNSTNTDAIESVIPSIRPGEHLLMNGKSLTRDCGVTSLPVIIMADSDGKVKNVNLGLNRDLGNIVLQTMALTD